MKNRGTRKLSLDRPVIYEVKVPGYLDEKWTAWNGHMTITTGCAPDGQPVTTLTGSVDQAGLQGLLRRLYSLGLPLLSVFCLDCDPELVIRNELRDLRLETT